MPATPEIDIDYVARLARLNLTDAERAEFAGQLSQVLGYVELMNQLELDEVTPMAHSTDLADVMRADENAPGLEAEAALQNAPQRVADQFSVPKVIDPES